MKAKTRILSFRGLAPGTITSRLDDIVLISRCSFLFGDRTTRSYSLIEDVKAINYYICLRKANFCSYLRDDI